MNRDYKKLTRALADLARKYPMIRSQAVQPDPSCDHADFDFCVNLMDEIAASAHARKTQKTLTTDALKEKRLANMAKGRELSGNKGGRPSKNKEKST